MPKKKINKNTSEGLKEAGNNAFFAGSFTEAIKFYTEAIEMS